MRVLRNHQRNWLCDYVRSSDKITTLQRIMIMNILNRSSYDQNEKKRIK